MDIKSLELLFNNVKAELLPIGDLVLDAGTQQRDKVDKTAIEGYAESMKAGGVEHWEGLEVVEITHDHKLPDGSVLMAGAHVLVNGFHRVDAAVDANYDKFPQKVVQGTFKEAVYYSMIANKKNGVSLKGKDFQKAIKKLYSLDPAWREHGKKQELALMFGCSTKTVERAVKAIDVEIKQQAFNMFADGKTDNEVMAFSHKSLNTVKAWREEYEQELLDAEGGDGGEGGDGESGDGGDSTGFLNITINDALKIADKEIQAAILAILTEAYGTPEQPQKEKAGDGTSEPEKEPQDATGEPESVSSDDPMEQLAVELESKGDCYAILGLDPAKVSAYANPKAQVNRAYNKLLKQCHPDRFGANRAQKVLADALAEIKQKHNIK